MIYVVNENVSVKTGSYGRLFPPENKYLKYFIFYNSDFFFHAIASIYHNFVKNRVMMSELRDINS